MDAIDFDSEISNSQKKKASVGVKENLKNMEIHDQSHSRQIMMSGPSMNDSWRDVLEGETNQL